MSLASGIVVDASSCDHYYGKLLKALLIAAGDVSGTQTHTHARADTSARISQSAVTLLLVGRLRKLVFVPRLFGSSRLASFEFVSTLVLACRCRLTLCVCMCAAATTHVEAARKRICVTDAIRQS